MAQITSEQAAQLDRDVAYMRKAGMGDDDVEQYVNERLSAWGATSAPFTEKSAAEQALTALPPVAGAVVGGYGVPALAERYLPAALMSWIPRAVLSGTGQAIGTTGGLMATGVPPKEAAQGGLQAGLLGGAVEGGINLGSRLVGATTSLPNRTISETLARPTSEAIGLMRKPAEAAERNVGLEIFKRLGGARSEISEGRLTKVANLSAAEASGVRVPLNQALDAIDNGISDAGMAVGRENSVASARLNALKKGLAEKFPDGTMSPTEADAQLRALQRDADAAGTRGNRFLASTYYKLKDAIRGSFHDAVDQAVPGSDMAKATAQARTYLDAVDTLDSFMSEKTPESFVRSLFRGEDQAQSALQALRTFEKETGSNGALEKEIRDLSLKRDWTSDERGRAFSVWRAVEKIIAKPLTKAGVIAARPAGQAAAAYAAYRAASDAMNNP